MSWFMYNLLYCTVIAQILSYTQDCRGWLVIVTGWKSLKTDFLILQLI